MKLPLSLSIGVLAGLAWCQVRPPNYSPDRLPETRFTCEDKVSGSYYADVEASCQLFHVCVQVSELEFQDFHFLCPNDTVFDQQHLVCTNWFDVDCQQSLSFFPHDFAFDKGRPEDYHDYTDYKERPDYDYVYEDVDSDSGTQTFLGFSQPASSGLQNGGRGQNQGSSPEHNQNFDYYDNEDEDARRGQRPPPPGTPAAGRGLTKPPIATTPIPLGFTTTRRPPHGSPRVKSDLAQRARDRPGGVTGRPRQEEAPRTKPLPPARPSSPFDNPPFISADGRKPRVKANINNQRIVSGNSQNKGKGKKQGSKKVELDRSQFSKIDFVEPAAPHAEGPAATERPFGGPEVRPDGRLPRVKANVRARERHQGFATSPRPRPTERPRNGVTPADTFPFTGTFPSSGFRGTPAPVFQGTPAVPPQGFATSPRPGFGPSSQRPFIPHPTPAVPSFNANPRPNSSPGSFVPRPTPAVPRERPFSPQAPFIPQPTPAVPPSSFLPPSRPSRPRPTDQFGPEQPRQGTGDREQPRFPVRQEPRPAPGIRQPTSPRPFTARPSPRPFGGSPSPRPFGASPTPRPFGGSPSPQHFGASPSPRPFGASPSPRPFGASPSPRPFTASPRPFGASPSSRPFGASPSPRPFGASPSPRHFGASPSPRPFGASPSPRPFGASPRPFTPAPQQAVPRPTSPQSANPFGFLTTPAPPQPTSAQSFAFTSPRPGPNFPPAIPKNRNRFGSRPSGRPRVKANILAQKQQKKQSSRDGFRERPRSQISDSRRHKRPEGVKFKTITDVNNEIEEEAGKCFNPFHCPPTKTAGGRRPRVKSNIKARKRNFWNPRKSRVIKRRKQVKLNRKLWENVRRGRKQRVGPEESGAPLDNSISNEAISGSIPLDIRASGPTTPDPISSLQRLVASKASEDFPPARRFQNQKLRTRQRITSRGRGRQGGPTSPTPGRAFVTTVAPIVSPPTEAPRAPPSPTSAAPPSPTPRRAAHTPRRINAPSASPVPSRRRPPEVEALIRRFGAPQVEKPRGPKPSFDRNFGLGPPPQPKIPPGVAALLKRFGPPRNARPQTTARPATTTTVSLFVTNPNFLADTSTPPPAPSGLPASRPTQNAPQSPFTASDMGLFVTNPRALPDHHKASRNPFSQPPQRSPDGRRPRVKSDIMATLQNRPGPPQGLDAELQENKQTTQRTAPVLRIKPDGRSPRVKSNQRRKKNQKKMKEFRKLRKQFQLERSGRSQDPEADEENSVLGNDSDGSDDYVEPELRPDGKKPRIKSNLKAKQSAKGSSQSGKQKKSSFRHSQRVHHSSTGPFEATTPLAGSEEGTDERGVAVTTFRPIIALEEFKPGTPNETVPAPVTKLSVPLPNFDKERFAEAVFQPTPRGFSRSEPAFSEAAVAGAARPKMQPAAETATEIVKVSSKDQNLFDSDYNYEDYYYDQINSLSS